MTLIWLVDCLHDSPFLFLHVLNLPTTYFSNQNRAYFELIQLLDSLGCPKKAFGEVLNKWVKKHCPVSKDPALFNPQTKHPTRDYLIRTLGKQLGLSPPEAIPVALEHDPSDRNTPLLMKSTSLALPIEIAQKARRWTLSRQRAIPSTVQFGLVNRFVFINSF